MIGTTITRKADGARFTVTGRHEGRFILAGEDFGSPLAVDHAALLADFKVKPADLTVPPSEAEVLRARDAEINRTINQAYGRAVAGKGKPPAPFTPPEDSPEATFAKIAEDDS